MKERQVQLFGRVFLFHSCKPAPGLHKVTWKQEDGNKSKPRLLHFMQRFGEESEKSAHHLQGELASQAPFVRLKSFQRILRKKENGEGEREGRRKREEKRRKGPGEADGQLGLRLRDLL